MEHDTEQPHDQDREARRPGASWQQDEMTASTMPASDQMSEQPTIPIPVARPQDQPLWPVAQGRRVKAAKDFSLATQVGLGCGGLLLVSVLAILVATVLSTEGIPGFPGKGGPLGPSATTTPVTLPTQLPTLAPTITPGPTATATAEPTATPEPSPTATLIPSPTLRPSPTATASP